MIRESSKSDKIKKSVKSKVTETLVFRTVIGSCHAVEVVLPSIDQVVVKFDKKKCIVKV